jgi:chorismate lyase/3-hydroxybenzoate synthase
VTVASPHSPQSLRPHRLGPLRHPGWVEELLGSDARETMETQGHDWLVHVTESADFAFLRIAVPGAADLEDAAFRRAVRDIYCTLAAALSSRGAYPLRLWNYVPQMHYPHPGGANRYEVFNAGRFDAYGEWYKSGDFGERVAAASAVDPRGRDLSVHVLAGSSPGTPVENPRQIPSYRYSQRYGQLPPCFARAMRLDRTFPGHRGVRSAIVSGTASIVGEHSRHRDHLELQLRETCLNLASLSEALVEEPGAAPSPGVCSAEMDEGRLARSLSRYRTLRAYVVNKADAGHVVACLRRTFPDLTSLEIVSADLCRRELLVEVEGTVCCEA